MPYFNIMKMSRSSSQDQTNIPLIVTTNETGTARPSSSTASNLDSSFKAKSCRSFVRQPKLNNEQHRNKSVPQNLQVFLFHFLDSLFISKRNIVEISFGCVSVVVVFCVEVFYLFSIHLNTLSRKQFRLFLIEI